MNNALLNSRLVSKRVELVCHGLVIQSSIRRLIDSNFYTSEGYLKVEICVATTIIESKNGKHEYICGVRYTDGRQMALKIRDNKVAFDDIPAFINLNCNYNAINSTIETYLKNKHLLEIEEKEIEIELKTKSLSLV